MGRAREPAPEPETPAAKRKGWKEEARSWEEEEEPPKKRKRKEAPEEAEAGGEEAARQPAAKKAAAEEGMSKEEAEQMRAAKAEFFKSRAQREVFVRPLPYTATEDAVRQAMSRRADWFEAAVERVKVVNMGSLDRAAFVTLKTVEQAQKCAAELNGVKVQGTAVSVSFTRGGGVKPRETCMFFLEGKCTRGDSCSFAHPAAGAKAADAEGAQKGRRLAPCKFWAAGRCSRGAACMFSHERLEEVEPEEETPQASKLEADLNISLPAIFEDDNVLAINKPPCVLSHPSPGHWDSGTVAHGLVGRVPDAMMRPRVDHKEADSLIPRAMVHRLDQGTTGVMVVAKTPSAEQELRALFGAKDGAAPRPVTKRYVALLAGRPKQLEVDAALARDPEDPRRMVVQEDGKVARSILQLHRYDKQSGLSLATVEILTGRMHQIRVHCAHVGAPLAGDSMYGTSKSENRCWEALGDVGRPLLHAWALDLPHPTDEDGYLILRAPLPPDMKRFIGQVWPDLPEDPSMWESEPLPKKAAKAAKADGDAAPPKSKKKAKQDAAEEEAAAAKPKKKAVAAPAKSRKKAKREAAAAAEKAPEEEAPKKKKAAKKRKKSEGAANAALAEEVLAAGDPGDEEDFAEEAAAEEAAAEEAAAAPAKARKGKKRKAKKAEEQ